MSLQLSPVSTGVKKTFRISVVIPTYAAGKLLRRSVTSVRESANNSGCVVSILVIDNHPEGKDSQIKNLVDEYIPLPKNPGFGTACNAGIQKAIDNFDPEWILLLNPDAYIDETFFSIFVQLMGENNAPIEHPISPLICYPQKFYSGKAGEIFNFTKNERFHLFDEFGTIAIYRAFDQSNVPFNQSFKTLRHDDVCLFKNLDGAHLTKFGVRISESDTGERFNYSVALVCQDKIRVDWQVQNAGSVVYPPFSAGDLGTYWLASSFKNDHLIPRASWCGASVLLPISYLAKVGGFDERFFLYYEDSEMAIRGDKFGLTPLFTSKLIVFHEHSATTNAVPVQRSRAIWESRTLFITICFKFRFSILYSIGLALRMLKLVIFRQTSAAHVLNVLLPEVFYSSIGSLRGLTRNRIRRFRI